jgi:hypothetical protein
MSKKKKGKSEEDETMELIKENLTCSVLKRNYIDDPSVILGYPIVRSSSKFNPNKIELYPIPEMLSYEGFLSEIDNQQEKLDLYFETNFRSSGNEAYNCWMPVYINKTHYEKNKAHILNSFSIIKFGAEGKKEYDFKPDQIFEILPIVLNKMIIGMFNGKAQISSAFIKSYFQYVLLFKKLCDDFEDENLAFMNKQLALIHDNEYKIDKKIIPDIGNFLMILFFCNKDTHEEQMKKMWDCLFEEVIIRSMFWGFHSDENKEKMKKLVLKTRNNNTCMRRFENEPNFKMRYLDKFIADLNNLKLFDQIVDIINKDEKFLESVVVGKENIKQQIINSMSQNFKKLFCGCGEDGRNQIKKIISENLDFSDYFIVVDSRYDNFQVSDILKDENIKNKEEIVETLFNSQRGNKLLIITFFAQKKVEEKGFLEELEKNYGIYLEVDDFIEEMQKKLEEIKTFKQLLEYVESDYGKDKTDIEIIIEAYDKAKEKNYISRANIQNIQRNNNIINNDLFRRNNQNERNRNNRNRGRGRGRGRGGDRGRGRGRGFLSRGRRGYYRGGRRNYGESSKSKSRSRSRSDE